MSQDLCDTDSEYTSLFINNLKNLLTISLRHVHCYLFLPVLCGKFQPIECEAALKALRLTEAQNAFRAAPERESESEV